MQVFVHSPTKLEALVHSPTELEALVHSPTELEALVRSPTEVKLVLSDDVFLILSYDVCFRLPLCKNLHYKSLSKNAEAYTIKTNWLYAIIMPTCSVLGVRFPLKRFLVLYALSESHC